MNAFLASVRNLHEAVTAYRAGADWIDLKEPAAGALGAVAPATVAAVSAWLREQEHKVAVSATIGDCWETPSVMPQRVHVLAGTGVSYAKIGIYAASASSDLLATIAECCRVGPAIIVVCFAEDPPAARDVKALAATGVSGVMLDTANKDGPGLPRLLASEVLEAFVEEAHRYKLICGLAGSLRRADIEGLAALEADYLGFRGALCRGAARESELSLPAAAAIRARMNEVARLSAARQTARTQPHMLTEEN